MTRFVMYIVLFIYMHNEIMSYVSSFNFVSIIITVYRQIDTL